MRHARILLGALALALCPATAHAAGLIAPAQLVVHVRDLPGFAGAREMLEHTTSPYTWAHNTGGSRTWTEAQEEATNLEGLGFEEGAQGFYEGPTRESHGFHREAVSVAEVFATAAAAETEMRDSVSSARTNYEAPEGVEVTDRAIPGAVTMGNFSPRRPGATDNVFFITGRCFFLIGNAVHSARSRAAAARAPLAAALALYRRDKRLCA